VDEIVLREVNIDSGLRTEKISLTPTKMRFLGVINGDSEIELLREQWDIHRITRNLADWVLEITRSKIAIWIFIILALYLVTSIALVLITNLPAK
ncbi:unnamed protein product, partial [marine sediment metagenome]